MKPANTNPQDAVEKTIHNKWAAVTIINPAQTSLPKEFKAAAKVDFQMQFKTIEAVLKFFKSEYARPSSNVRKWLDKIKVTAMDLDFETIQACNLMVKVSTIETDDRITNTYTLQRWVSVTSELFNATTEDDRKTGVANREVIHPITKEVLQKYTETLYFMKTPKLLCDFSDVAKMVENIAKSRRDKLHAEAAAAKNAAEIATLEAKLAAAKK